MTREEFLYWAATQEGRFEFDGFQPVAMTGGSRDHSRIMLNIQAELRGRLKGSGCEPLGQDAGIATIGDAVRYPDALVTCTRGAGTDRLIPAPVAVFEVLSPTSGRVDRIDKLREYQAVASIRRYVVLEHASVALTVHARAEGAGPWTTAALTENDILSMPEINAEIPVAAFYEGTDLLKPSPPDAGAGSF